MKRLLINCTLAGVIAYAIVACGGDGTTSTTDDPTVHGTGWGRDVREITLSDGTLCVVARNSDAGIAITCDWGAR